MRLCRKDLVIICVAAVMGAAKLQFPQISYLQKEQMFGIIEAAESANERKEVELYGKHGGRAGSEFARTDDESCGSFRKADSHGIPV